MDSKNIALLKRFGGTSDRYGLGIVTIDCSFENMEALLDAARKQGHPGAIEAFAALDLADGLLERALGTDVPQEWHDAYAAVAAARQAPEKSR